MQDEDGNNPEFYSFLQELLGYSSSIALAHRNMRIFEYLAWQWQLRQRFNDSQDPMTNGIESPLDAVNLSLEAMLSDDEPDFRLAIEQLLEIIGKQNKLN